MPNPAVNFPAMAEKNTNRIFFNILIEHQVLDLSLGLIVMHNCAKSLKICHL